MWSFQRVAVTLASIAFGCSSSHRPESEQRDAASSSERDATVAAPSDDGEGSGACFWDCGGVACAEYTTYNGGCVSWQCAEQYACPPIEPGCAETTIGADLCERCAWRAGDVSCIDGTCGDGAECEPEAMRCPQRLPTRLTFDLEIDEGDGLPLPRAGDLIEIELVEHEFLLCRHPLPLRDHGGHYRVAFDGALPSTTIEIDAFLLRDRIYRPRISLGERLNLLGFGVTTYAPVARVPMGAPSETSRRSTTRQRP